MNSSTRTMRQQAGRPSVHIRGGAGGQPPFERRFSEPFSIGRDESCQVQVEQAGCVSRRHTEVFFKEEAWWVRDLGSTNGTYLDGKRVEQARLQGTHALRLGRNGPMFQVMVEGGREAEATFSDLDGYIRHYLETGADASPSGKHTMMIRRAYGMVRRRQRRLYGALIAAAVAVALAMMGLAIWRQVHYEKIRDAAQQIFYSMKEQDVRIAQLRSLIEGRGDERLEAQLARLEEGREEQARRYEGFIDDLGIYHKLNDEERIIFHVTRIFNESEIRLPAGFVAAVQRKIKTHWLPARESLKRTFQEAEAKGYMPFIVKALRRHGLPPQFFYLALQESRFDPRAVGPRTRFGYAKGMWQFIPSTARRYGLDPGVHHAKPLADPSDERQDFQKATEAASRYLRDIYGELAQASGLLAMASYNWGEHRVIAKLRELPGLENIPEEELAQNPEARNYWRFYTEYGDRIPAQTKDYVLKIFAAAVIGENPRLFGFDFDNPLHPYLEAPPAAAEGVGEAHGKAVAR
ncbi:MAG: transglycosylase SLT domain-containing protein [Candidatus Aminicenantes bacterium]|nr:transglycosylase SLT domain-containing protein [Candidatus Aminicenantes bacterium]